MISIIIPTKNEPYIQTLVSDINKVLRQRHEIIIVDKSSVKPGVVGARLYIQKSKGLGNAIMEGLNYAKGEVIAIMDGDGSHDPIDLKKLIEKIPEYDIAIGSKLVKGGRTEDPFQRRIVTLCLSIFIRVVLLLNVKDPMTGFMVIKRSVIEDVKLKPKGFKIVLETIYKSRKRAKLIEVPITFHKRKAGESKVGYNINGYKEFFRIIILIINLRLDR